MSLRSFNAIGPAEFILCFGTVLLIAKPVRADPGDDFSNNLFSDLAPLLALFGEQVAKQFLSQSLSWLDSVIFAMAPLGIITAIVSAIRGEAELELMSSTSADVCELWNGETIVRTLGSPYITEVLWLEKVDAFASRSEDEAHGSLLSSSIHEDDGKLPTYSGVVYSLADAERVKLIKTAKHSGPQLGEPQTLSIDQLLESGIFELEAPGPVSSNLLESSDGTGRERSKPALGASKSPPNLSLNVSGKPTSTLELTAVAICSTILQCGVIAFEIVITYLHPFNQRFEKSGRAVGAYACPLTVAGTCLVVIGMFICCNVVQERSKEETWDFDKVNIPVGYRLNVAWLQRHQIVTDQNFGAFCLYAPPDRHQIMTSWFNTNRRSQNVSTLVGTAISVVGFVVQFTGLRGMHYSATLAQLAATLFVSLFRIMIRRQLGNRPILEAVPDEQELDWMARKTTRCSKWAVKPLSPANPPDYGDLGTFSARCKLREICPWPLENSSLASMAESLARSFEEITNYVYSSDIKLKDEAQDLNSFDFPVHIAYSKLGSKDSHRATIRIKMYRDVVSGDRSGSWTSWKTDRYAIEAILTLWKLSIAEDEEQPETGYNDRDKSIVLLGPRLDFHILDYDLFVGPSNRCSVMKAGIDDLETRHFPVPGHRVFGYMGPDPKAEHLALVSFSYLPDLCARHILTCYFYQLCQLIHTLNGQTTVLRSTQFDINASTLRMNNTHLDSIFDLLHSNGVPGTREDFFMILVPALQKNGNLLRVFDAFSTIIREARDAEASGMQPSISKDMLFHMADRALKTFRSNSYWLHAGDFVFGLLETCQLVLGNDHEWTQTARAFACRACHSIEVQLFCEIEFQDDDGLKTLSAVCRNLSLHCDRVLGKESPESQILSRLYLRTQESGTISVAELYVSPMRANVRRQASSASSPTQRSPADNMDGTLDPGSKIGDPIMHEIQTFRPSLDLSFIKEFPPKAWACVKEQDLVALYKLLKPKEDRLTPEEITLISHTFIIAAACGYSRVIGLCLAKFRDSCCDTIGGSGVSFSTAITLATMNNDSVVVDLILSSLDHDQITLLDYPMAVDGSNCLQIACREGFVDIAHLLLRAGVNPSGPEFVQDSTDLPVYLAARSNSTAIISLLLFYGVPASYQDFISGETLLHCAIRSGAEETMDYLLSPETNFASLFFIYDYDGNNALNTAIIYGRDQAAIKLFNAIVGSLDFDIQNKRNGEGKTAFHLACEYNRAELVKIFLAHGFKTDKTIYYAYTAFEIAAIFGSCDVGAVLLEADSNSTILPSENGPSPIILAAENSKPDYVRFLLENGAPINSTERLTNMTPILIAASRGDMDLFDLLLANDADTDVTDVEGQTIAHFAAQLDSAVCLERLFSNVRSPRQASRILMQPRSKGEIPFQLALWHGSLAAARVLFEKAIDLGASSKSLAIPMTDGLEGMGPLQLICSLFTYEIDDTATITTLPSIKPALRQYVEDSASVTRPVIPLFARRPISHGRRPIKVWNSTKKEDEAIELLGIFLGETHDSCFLLDNLGFNLLKYAAVGGQAEACKLLLEKEDISQITIPKLQEPLKAALYTGAIGVIKVIIAATAKAIESASSVEEGPIDLLLNPACKALLQIAGKTRGNASAPGALLVDTSEGLQRGPWESDVELLECLQLFIDSGANGSCVEPDEWSKEETLLHAAIHCKSAEVIDLLVAAGAVINPGEGSIRSLLHYALAEDSSYVALIPALCRNGVDVNSVDKDGHTPLSIEIQMRRLATVTALLDNGAVIRTVGPWPDLAHAANAGNGFIFKLLCRRYKEAAATHDEYIKFLNGTSFLEWPTVHVAARIGHLEILNHLWDEGADMSVLDDEGCNALVSALESPSLMRLLVRAGVDPDHKASQTGATAAHYAVEAMDDAHEVITALRVLFELGADLNITDSAGMTPMDYCTNGSRTDGWRADEDMKKMVLEEFKRHQATDGHFIVREGTPRLADTSTSSD
ncbi:Ankyrin-2 [Orbilia brochopaga]|nr:Ankyrin-2 [Drechslerella brochopaga]